MWANNLVVAPRVESGGRSEVILVRKDLHKAGGREQDTSHESKILIPA